MALETFYKPKQLKNAKKNSLGFTPMLFGYGTYKGNFYAKIGYGEITSKWVKVNKDGKVTYDGKRFKV